MRLSTIACSFLASSYSEFSEMSPNSRASLMRSATSRRFVVERWSISCLSFSSPSGVRMTSFCMRVLPGGGNKKPARGGSGGGRGYHRHQRLNQGSLIGERGRRLEGVLGGAPGAEPLDVPGVELLQVARRALVAEVLGGAVEHPQPLG